MEDSGLLVRSDLILHYNFLLVSWSIYDALCDEILDHIFGLSNLPNYPHKNQNWC